MTENKLAAPGYIVLTSVTRKTPILVPLPLLGAFQVENGYCLVTPSGYKDAFPAAESLKDICELLKQERTLALEIERKVFDASERTATETDDAEQKPSDVPAAAAGDWSDEEQFYEEFESRERAG